MILIIWVFLSKTILPIDSRMSTSVGWVLFCVESNAKAQRYSVLTYPLLVVTIQTSSRFREDREKGFLHHDFGKGRMSMWWNIKNGRKGKLPRLKLLLGFEISVTRGASNFSHHQILMASNPIRENFSIFRHDTMLWCLLIFQVREENYAMWSDGGFSFSTSSIFSITWSTVNLCMSFLALETPWGSSSPFLEVLIWIWIKLVSTSVLGVWYSQLAYRTHNISSRSPPQVSWHRFPGTRMVESPIRLIKSS